MKEKISQRKKSYAIIFLLLGSSLLPLVSNLSAAVVPSNPTNQNQGSALVDDTQYWALLVGVGDYAENPEQDRPDMISEVNDLHALLLQSSWWPEDHIKVLTGADATVVNIIKGLRWLDRMEKSNDISLVYLSTHGFPLGFDIPPKDEADGTDEALVSYWGFAYPSLFIWDDELNVLLNRLESKGVCLIVDSCYAGGFNDPPNWNISGVQESTQMSNSLAAEQWVRGFGEDVRGQKRVVLMGSCEDELSYSGGFGPYIIDGLRGYADTNEDGIVTAEEVFYYAQPRSTPRQHPTMYDGYDGELPLINAVVSASTSKNENSVQMTQKTGDDQTTQMITAETSILCGYIQDAETNSSIENAVVYARGRINQNEYYENETTTDSMGFYQMSTPAIRLRVTASADGYCSRETGQIQMYENETRWVNISLYERPPETAIVCGYITDEDTTDPLDSAYVNLTWEGTAQQYYQNETITENTGFYQMSVAAGTISLQIEQEGYFSEYLQELTIGDSQTLWVNVSLTPRPVESATICGYLTDNETGTPLSGARIDFEWIDFETNQSYGKETQTNTSGFYSINIAPGETYMDIRATGYDYYDPYRHDGIANQTKWLNCSLTPSIIDIEINRPLNALYIQNQLIMPWNSPRIIGAINISVIIPWGWWGEENDVEKVEFYIDNDLQTTLTEQPYNWTWSQHTIGKHIIKVIAYDFNGDTTVKEVEVNKFL
jgi:hypothetical protein